MLVCCVGVVYFYLFILGGGVPSPGVRGTAWTKAPTLGARVVCLVHMVAGMVCRVEEDVPKHEGWVGVYLCAAIHHHLLSTLEPPLAAATCCFPFLHSSLLPFLEVRGSVPAPPRR